MIQKILIVDDKPANLMALRQTLTELDVEVVSATTGNDALVASLNHDFALAILDVQMPGMNGYELAELLRSDDRTTHLPILFVSAIYHDDHHIFRGYQAGAVDFLVKPYNPEVLLNKLRFFLKLDAQSRSLKDQLALEQSMGFLQSIVSSAADAVFVEVNDKLTLVNPAAEKLVGPASNFIGRSIASVFSDPGLIDTLENGVRQPTYLRSATGDPVPVNLVLSKLEGRPGRVLLATDRTDAIREARAKDQLREQLYHAQRLESVGRMAGGVAHDLNNVFTIIQTCCGLLQQDQDLDTFEHVDLDYAMNAAKQGEVLVRQLLAFGRKQHMRPCVVDLHDAVSDAFDMIDRLMNPTIEISIIGPDEPLTIEVDPDQLMQVLVNLAVNARDAMPDGGVLQVTIGEDVAEDGGQWAYIEVADNGQGMEASVVEHIFEPFFTTKDPDTGTGLGLSVVHGIVSQSGGILSVESVPGQGTTFRISFKVTSLPINTSEENLGLDRASSTDTILVVEDNPAVLRMVVKVLERNGFEVLQALDLEQAIDAARATPSLTLLFTDFNLPETTGDQVAAEIRKIHPDLPVLLMSGNAQQMLPEGKMPEAPAAFLQKPFVPRVLVDMVHETIGDNRAVIRT